MDPGSSPGVGEPGTMRGRRSKDRIVAAAAASMHRHGVAATTVDDVLRAAGAGKSQFYHYFATKTDLVEAVLWHQLEGVLRQQRAFDLGTWEGIRGWLDAMLAEHDRRGFEGGCPLGAIVAEVTDQDERLRVVAAEAFTRWQRALVDGLETLRRDGGVRTDIDADALADEAIAAIQGGYLLSTARRDARPMRNALDATYVRLRSFAV